MNTSTKEQHSTAMQKRIKVNGPLIRMFEMWRKFYWMLSSLSTPFPLTHSLTNGIRKIAKLSKITVLSLVRRHIFANQFTGISEVRNQRCKWWEWKDKDQISCCQMESGSLSFCIPLKLYFPFSNEQIRTACTSRIAVQTHSVYWHSVHLIFN